MSKAVRYAAPFAAAVLAVSLSGCFDGNSSVSSSSIISGVAQKGPMAGATVTVYKLDASGNRGGKNVAGTANSDGYYAIEVPWEGPSEVVAEGVYVDELTGAPSADSVSLRAFTAVKDSTTTICNLNMLVHLATARAKVLMAADSNLGVSTAMDTAAGEVAVAFGLAGTDLDALDVTDGAGDQLADNAQLLLLSAATGKQAVDDTTATTGDLLADLEADISDDGLLNSAGADTLGAIGTAASSINLDTDIAITGTDLPGSTDLSSAPSWLNYAPAAANVTTQLTDEDTASAAITLGGTDSDGDSLQVEVTTGPANGSLSATSGAAPLSVVYTPAANYNGSDSFSYRVFDGVVYSTTENVAFTVTAVNDAPVATAVSTVTTDEDITSAAFDLTGSDIENDTMTVEIVTNPSNGGLVYSGSSAPISVTYVPSADYNGSDSFQFRVSDGNGGQSDAETVNLSVTPTNDAPVFTTIANQAAVDGVAFSFTAAATDVDGDTLSYSSTGTVLPSWATLTTASGEISGTPDAVATTSGIEISAYDGTVTVASNTFDLVVDVPVDGASCAHILVADSGATDGVYTVDPDGNGGVDPFAVYCDMTTDGGGWAKIYQYPTRFYNSSTAAVGNIAVATNAAEAKLSDAQINAFQTLSGATGSEFRMAGDKHPSGHKLFVRSSGTWQDDVTAFQLFNPQAVAGNNLAACLAADRASCALGNYTHADYWLDTLRMGGGNLPTGDNTTRFFIDHGTQPRCWNGGFYPERCFATGASAGNAPIGNFTMWVRPN